MKDLYLKISEKQALIDFLAAQISEKYPAGIILDGNYLQNEALIIDFIGKIPRTFNEEGEVTEWTTEDRFNVRLIDESVTLFDAFDNVYPEVPYRMFS